MDRSEQLAQAHLRGRGFTEVVYEPDGNIPPDFLVEQRIAVEVRQLNQLEQTTSRGVDETGWPLRDRVAGVLATYGESSEGTHWLGLRYRRPLPEARAVVRGTRAFVESILSGSVQLGTARAIAGDVVLEYAHFGDGPGDAFRIGTTLDFNLGGFVVPELRRSLETCVAEKSRKTAAYRSPYGEWWLVLIDKVGYGLSERSLAEFRGLPELEHDWDRIVVVNPLDPASYFEMGGPT